MQKPAAPQKTVLETILDWSKDRPLWQRDALRRIIANGRLTDADLGELVDLCKQGKGPPVGALKAVPLEKAHLPANPRSEERRVGKEGVSTVKARGQQDK